MTKNPGLFGGNLAGNSTDLVGGDVTHIEYEISRKLWIYVGPILLVVGTVGSGLSLLVLCQRSMRQQTTMFYLAVLAVLDVAVLYTGLLRLWLENQMDIYIRLHSSMACKLHNILVYVCLDASVWVTVAVSVDRCIFVSLPHKAKQWCTMVRARRVIGLILLCVFFINCHFFWTYDRETTSSNPIAGNNRYQCFAVSHSESITRFIESVWPWIDFCKFCLIPFSIMTVTTFIIVRQLVRSDRKMAQHRRASIAPKRPSIQPMMDKDDRSRLSQDNDTTDGVYGEDKNTVQEDKKQITHNGLCNGTELGTKSKSDIRGILKEKNDDKGIEHDTNQDKNALISKIVIVGSHEQISNKTDHDNKTLKPQLQIPQELSSEASTIELQDTNRSDGRMSALGKDVKPVKGAFGNFALLNSKSTSFKSNFDLPKFRRNTQVTPYHPNTSIIDEVVNSESRDKINTSNITSTSSQRQVNIGKNGGITTFETTNNLSDNTKTLSSHGDNTDVDVKIGMPEIEVYNRQNDFYTHHNIPPDIPTTEPSNNQSNSLCHVRTPRNNQTTGSDIIEVENKKDASLDTFNYTCINNTLCSPVNKTVRNKEGFSVCNNTNLHPDTNEKNVDVNVNERFKSKHLHDTLVLNHDHNTSKQIDCQRLCPANENHTNSDVQRVSQVKVSNNVKNIFDPTAGSHGNFPTSAERRNNTSEPKCNHEHKVHFIDTTPTEKALVKGQVSVNHDKDIENKINVPSSESVNTILKTDNNTETELKTKSVKHQHSFTSKTSIPKISITRALKSVTTHHPIAQSKASNDGLSPDVTTPPTNKRRRTISTSSTTQLVTSSSSGTSRMSSRAIYITLVTMNAVFVLLNAPIMVYVIGFTYWTRDASDTLMAKLTLGWTIVNILQYSNSAGHFFLYCLTGPKFRQLLRQIIKSFYGRVKYLWGVGR